jgi:hypothetical protein
VRRSGKMQLLSRCHRPAHCTRTQGARRDPLLLLLLLCFVSANSGQSSWVAALSVLVDPRGIHPVEPLLVHQDLDPRGSALCTSAKACARRRPRRLGSKPGGEAGACGCSCALA